jgi:DNA-binding FadR family transcriptional regulator
MLFWCLLRYTYGFYAQMNVRGVGAFVQSASEDASSDAHDDPMAECSDVEWQHLQDLQQARRVTRILSAIEALASEA